MNDILKIKKVIEERKRITSWLDRRMVRNYTINSDFTVDVNGDVHLGNLETLPIQFRRVTGTFNMSVGYDLISLKGCPSWVGEGFHCSFNTKLESLQYCPIYVRDGIWCQGGNLKTLEHAPMKPMSYEGNPCSYIYDELGFTIKAHQRCKEVFGL